MQNLSDNTILTIKNDNDKDFFVVIEAIRGNELADSIKDVELQQASLEQDYPIYYDALPKSADRIWGGN